MEAIKVVIDSDHVSDSNKKDWSPVLVSARKKLEDIRAKKAVKLAAEKEAREKREVREIHECMSRLAEKLNSTDNETLRDTIGALLVEFRGIQNKPSFGRYAKEFGEECVSLTKHFSLCTEGIAESDRLSGAIDNLISEIGKRLPSGEEIKRCEDLLSAADVWESKYATIVGWKRDRIEESRKKIVEFQAASVDRASIIAKANGASDYDTLYSAVQELVAKYADCDECVGIDISRILSVSQINSVIAKSGFFSSNRLFDFVGMIRIDSKNKDHVIPMINNSVGDAHDVYCVVQQHNLENQNSELRIKKILEKTSAGYRKVNDFDYFKCQGIGLFVSKDPSYVDIDSWKPGLENTRHPHWVSSAKPGEWIPEPGYAKTSIFGSTLGEVEWKPNLKYLNGKVRSGRNPGDWQQKVDCSVCDGSGKETERSVSWRCHTCGGSGKLQNKIKCERCPACNWRGYKLSKPYPCFTCKGEGVGYKYRKVKCALCNGDGFYWVDVNDTKTRARILDQIKRGE